MVKMKICMFASTFLPTIGGLQYQVKWLAEGIAEQGEEIYLLTPNDATLYIEQKENGFPKNINLNFNKNHFLNVLKLRKALNEIKPDVVHAHSALPSGFYTVLANSLKFENVPIIITSHGDDIMTLKEIKYGLRLSPIHSFLIKSTLRRCSKHVIVGKSMKKYAIDAGSSADKIVEINNCIPPERDIPEDQLKEVKYKYNISQDENILLSLSGMRPLKGLEYLLMAMPEVIERFPNTRLLLAAKGKDYEKYLKNIVKNLKLEKNVDFIGFVTGDEKWALIKLCNVLCKPSLLEACSVAILEAMQQGTVVMASIPGGIDIITHGQNGLLTKTSDPVDIAEKIITILEDGDLRERVEKQAKKDVKNFDVKKIAKRYISIYKIEEDEK